MPGSKPSPGNPERGKGGAMKLSVRENMAPGPSLIEKFRNLRDLGFDGVELTGSSNPELLDEIRAALRETGIQPSITSGRLGGCLVDSRKEERELAVRSHLEALELAAAIGAVGVISPPTITMKMQVGRPRVPDLRPVATREEVERQMVIALYKEIAARAPAGTCIIVEPLNRYEQFFPHTLRQGVELCNAVASPACRMMADLFHMNIEESSSPAAIREAGAGMIVNVHLADNQRQLPGTGQTDFAACFRALKEIGYDGFLGLECGVHGDPMTSLRECAAWLRRTYEAA